MNGKCLGMKVKHMGMKWMWVDDQSSSLASESNSLITEVNLDLDKSVSEVPNGIDGLANIRFEIAEEPEFKKSRLEKLEIDEFPGVLPRLRHKSFIPRTIIPKVHEKRKYTSPWYVKPQKWNGIAKTFESRPVDEKYRLKNLYFYLHKDKNTGTFGVDRNKMDQKYHKLQETIQSLDLTSKFQKYLESKKLRIPSYLNPL